MSQIEKVIVFLSRGFKEYVLNDQAVYNGEPFVPTAKWKPDTLRLSTESEGEAAKWSPHFQWRRYNTFQHEATTTFW